MLTEVGSRIQIYDNVLDEFAMHLQIHRLLAEYGDSVCIGQLVAALARSSAAAVAAGKCSRAAPTSSAYCAVLVALQMGAVRPGRLICQASATWAGVLLRACAAASSAASTAWPRGVK